MTAIAKTAATERRDWVVWLDTYSAAKFYDAFMLNAQDACGHCVQCNEPIFLDIREGGGVPDWRTRDGDYGCVESPETTDEGVGSHRPLRLAP